MHAGVHRLHVHRTAAHSTPEHARRVADIPAAGFDSVDRRQSDLSLRAEGAPLISRRSPALQRFWPRVQQSRLVAEAGGKQPTHVSLNPRHASRRRQPEIAFGSPCLITIICQACIRLAGRRIVGAGTSAIASSIKSSTATRSSHRGDSLSSSRSWADHTDHRGDPGGAAALQLQAAPEGRRPQLSASKRRAIRRSRAASKKL